MSEYQCFVEGDHGYEECDSNCVELRRYGCKENCPFWRDIEAHQSIVDILKSRDTENDAYHEHLTRKAKENTIKTITEYCDRSKRANRSYESSLFSDFNKVRFELLFFELDQMFNNSLGK